MTREDILKMPAGREMDALISMEYFAYSNKILLFSHNISAAWEVHKIICNPYNYASNKAQCYYGYLQQSIAERYSGGSPVYPYVLGFIEPIDICRAAILLTLEEK